MNTTSTTQPQSRARQFLGEGGFVFLDERPWAYAVKKHSDGWWLYYWSDSTKSFITLRSMSVDEVANFASLALPEEQQALYFKQ